MTQRILEIVRALSVGAAAVLAARAVASAPVSTPSSPLVPAAASPVTAAALLERVRSARGSVVLVNVWATWCVPCREEFPDLLRLRREYGGRGFRLVLVSADLASQRPQVEEFLRAQGVDFPTFAKAEADQEFIDGLERRWSGALPATLLFDREGRRVAFWEGSIPLPELRSRVAALVDQR